MENANPAISRTLDLQAGARYDLLHSLWTSTRRVWSGQNPRPALAADTAWLNGLAGSRLRTSYSREVRKATGMFPTGAKRAAALVSRLDPFAFDESRILDPACGTGDLLLSVARRMPTFKTPIETLKRWGEVLHGWDIVEDLVDITKARITMLAALRSGRVPAALPATDEILPEIRVLDGEKALNSEGSFTHIVLNPPFNQTKRQRKNGTQLISQAAVFLEQSIDALCDGGVLSALLPDVIRSGTRYKYLRDEIQQCCTISGLELQDQFETDADVHTFLVCLTKGVGVTTVGWSAPRAVAGNSQAVGDLFDVHVGPVVPHRHPLKGPWRPFLTSKALSGMTEFSATRAVNRRFTGTVFTPPFVAVRRTSRPGDRPRAASTVVLGEKPVAVENHLIVAQPHDGKLDSCRALAQFLHSSEANQWFDQRIRCRHLTVASINELLWR